MYSMNLLPTSKVDNLLSSTGSVIIGSRPGLEERMPRFAHVLLVDFFNICDLPNDAEMLMLTEACDITNVSITKEWCKSHEPCCHEAQLTILQSLRSKCMGFGIWNNWKTSALIAKSGRRSGSGVAMPRQGMPCLRKSPQIRNAATLS